MLTTGLHGILIAKTVEWFGSLDVMFNNLGWRETHADCWRDRGAFQASPFDGDLAEMDAAGLVTEGVGQLIEGEAASDQLLHRKARRQSAEASPVRGRAVFNGMPRTPWVRTRLAAGGDGFEPSVPLYSTYRFGPPSCRFRERAKFAVDLYGAFPVKRLFWVVLTVFCSERERPFFVPSPAIRSPERAEGVKGPKR
jgi:hypothetical protein